MRRAIATAVSFLVMASSIYGDDMAKMRLPKPKTKGTVSAEETIEKRRSVRSYGTREVSFDDISQLLWACQGITDASRGLRAAPSAGALYPLEVYLVKKDGIFHYRPEGHDLEKVSGKDVRVDLAAAAYGQRYIADAPISIVISAVYERVMSKYGERGIRYTDMEAGHAAQNVFLQAVALGLDSAPVGAFSDQAVGAILDLPKDVKPLYILPVGYRR